MSASRPVLVRPPGGTVPKNRACQSVSRPRRPRRTTVANRRPHCRNPIIPSPFPAEHPARRAQLPTAPDAAPASGRGQRMHGSTWAAVLIALALALAGLALLALRFAKPERRGRNTKPRRQSTRYPATSPGARRAASHEQRTAPVTARSNRPTAEQPTQSGRGPTQPGHPPPTQSAHLQPGRPGQPQSTQPAHLQSGQPGHTQPTQPPSAQPGTPPATPHNSGQAVPPATRPRTAQALGPDSAADENGRPKRTNRMAPRDTIER